MGACRQEFRAEREKRLRQETIPMTTQRDIQTQPQANWPLPPTLETHAHLTWAEWMVQQATNLGNPHIQALTFSAPNQRERVARLDRRTATRLTWPLQATLTPNARLSWAAWLDAQSRGPDVVRQDAIAQVAETAA